MAAKFIVFSLLVASVYGSGGYSSFSYGVSDPNTGDVKDQHEKRVGDSVVGKYSLLESDGTKRVVEYSANEATGFNAVVRKEPGVGGSASAAALAQNAALASAAPANHPASLGPAAAFAHGGPLGSRALAYPGALAHGALAPGAHGAFAPGALAHGALAPGALAHGAFAPGALSHGAFAPGAGAHGAIAPGALTHGTLANPLLHSNALAHGAHTPGAHANPHFHSGALSSADLASPIAHSGALAHGALANPLTNLGYPGYAGAGYANPLTGSLGARGAPAVSHYSHSIVHDTARPYGGPYAGANGGYGAYGKYGYGASAPGLVNPAGSLAHGVASPLANGWSSPLANGANGANGWSPAANGAYGAHGLGARLGW